jgi:hypothetical protein
MNPLLHWERIHSMNPHPNRMRNLRTNKIPYRHLEDLPYPIFTTTSLSLPPLPQQQHTDPPQQTKMLHPPGLEIFFTELIQENG